jgi:hypothetical protein
MKQPLINTLRSSLGGNVVVKTLEPQYQCLLRERENLARFQPRTLHIRPFLDEINPGEPSYALILMWVNEHAYRVTEKR